MTAKSGEYLGEILCTTALAYFYFNLKFATFLNFHSALFRIFSRELYLDGNDLRCEGAISLINRIAEECENEALRKEAEERAKEEEEARLAALAAEGSKLDFHK